MVRAPVMPFAGVPFEEEEEIGPIVLDPVVGTVEAGADSVEKAKVGAAAAAVETEDKGKKTFPTFH